MKGWRLAGYLAVRGAICGGIAFFASTALGVPWLVTTVWAVVVFGAMTAVRLRRGGHG